MLGAQQKGMVFSHHPFLRIQGPPLALGGLTAHAALPCNNRDFLLLRGHPLGRQGGSHVGYLPGDFV